MTSVFLGFAAVHRILPPAYSGEIKDLLSLNRFTPTTTTLKGTLTNRST